MVRAGTAAIDRARAQLVASASKFLPDLCTIQSITTTPDGAGGWTTATNDVEANVRCEYRALTAFEQASGDAIKAISTHKIKLAVTANALAIDGTYKLKVAANGNVPQQTFQVTGRLTGSTSLYVYLGATLEEA